MTGHKERTLHVDVNNVAERFRRNLLGGHIFIDAGIVDKHLKICAQSLFDPFAKCKDCFFVFDIELIAFNANAKFGLKLLFDFLRLVRLCAVGNDNVIAFACKFLCNSGAKTAGCAGHD